MTNFISEIFTNKLDNLTKEIGSNYQSAVDDSEFSSILSEINEKTLQGASPSNQKTVLNSDSENFTTSVNNIVVGDSLQNSAKHVLNNDTKLPKIDGVNLNNSVLNSETETNVDGVDKTSLDLPASDIPIESLSSVLLQIQPVKTVDLSANATITNVNVDSSQENSESAIISTSTSDNQIVSTLSETEVDLVSDGITNILMPNEVENVVQLADIPKTSKSYKVLDKMPDDTKKEIKKEIFNSELISDSDNDSETASDKILANDENTTPVFKELKNQLKETASEAKTVIDELNLLAKEDVSVETATLGTVFDMNENDEKTAVIFDSDDAKSLDSNEFKTTGGAAPVSELNTELNILPDDSNLIASLDDNLQINIEQPEDSLSLNSNTLMLKNLNGDIKVDFAKNDTNLDVENNTALNNQSDKLFSNQLDTKNLNVKKIKFEIPNENTSKLNEAVPSQNEQELQNVKTEIKLSTESSARLAGVEVVEETPIESTVLNMKESNKVDDSISETESTDNSENQTSEIAQDSSESDLSDSDSSNFKNNDSKAKNIKSESSNKIVASEDSANVEVAAETTTSQDELTDSIDDVIKISSKDVKSSAQTQVQTQSDFKEVTKSNIFSQINDKFAQLRNQNNGKVEIILKPEHLGKLNVEIQSQRGGITATLIAESPQVKEILEKNIETLKNNLNSQGVNVNNVNIKVDESAKSEFGNLDFNKEQFAEGDKSHNSKNRNEYTEESNYITDNSNSEKDEGLLDEGMLDERKPNEEISLKIGSVDYKV